MADGGMATPAMRRAGLVYVSDDMPGITRRRCGRGFAYYFDGTHVADENEVSRINALAIPPAYSDVWISPLANGHLQATGRDERERKQYRYHDDYRALREERKFGRLVAFGEALPGLRETVATDLRRRTLGRERVLATAVRMLERTLIRIGNRRYARENDSHGLTTLAKDHLEDEGRGVRLVFTGKGGKQFRLRVRDRRIRNTIRKLEDIDGQPLFQWLDDDGTARSVSSTDVNDYIREATGEDFTAKVFRTWGASVLATRALNALPRDFASEAEGNRNVVAAIDEVAAVLGNTRAVCRGSYVHPRLTEAYMEGRLHRRVRDPEPDALPFADEGLSALERSVLRLLGD